MKKLAVWLAALLMMLTAVSASALTVTGFDSESSTREWETSKFFSRMETLTGVAVEAHAVLEEEDYQKLIDGMLDGKVTADVLFKAELTRAQEKALLDAGAIIDLAPMIEANMPNLSALLAEHPDWKEIISLEDGRIASLPMINEAERQVCVWINTAWLDTLGLAMPQNTDELTQALLAFAQGDPNGNYKNDEVGADLLGVWEMRWLLPYFGIVADDYNIARVDGEAVFAPELPAYREFVALLGEWVHSGVLPEDAFTGVHGAALYNTESDEDEPVTSGLMVSVTPYTHVPVSAITQYQALLMADDSGETVWRDLLGSVWTGAFAVTSACEDPAAALRWVDALYGEEGAKLAYAGIEGEDYSFNEQGYWVFEVDAMRTVDTIRSEVLMYTGSTMPGLTPNAFLQKVDSEPDRHIIAESAKVQAAAQRVTSPYALSDAQQARANELSAVIGALVDKGIARFATGEVELSDENWDTWLNELRDAGSEELTALFNEVME